MPTNRLRKVLDLRRETPRQSFSRPTSPSRLLYALPLALAIVVCAVAAVTAGESSSEHVSDDVRSQSQTPSAALAVDAARAGAQLLGGEGACCFGGDQTTCVGDLNGDNTVDGLDLLALLSAWGSCADPQDCPADLNNDQEVDGIDLLMLLSAWGDCPQSTSGCEVSSLQACEDQGGYFLGAGSACANCPQPITCPGGAINESEVCGEAENDGCNLDPPAYGPILACNDVVCGTLWAEGNNRDEDWYRISITQDTRITWSVEAPYPVEVRILTAGCPPFIVATASGLNPSVQSCLPPGDYVLMVRPLEQQGLSCDSGLAEYAASVSCESCTAPTGACCVPENNQCTETAALTCFGLDEDAQYFGNGTSCSDITCPFGPPMGLCKGNCGVPFIDDTLGGFCHCDENFCGSKPEQCCPGVCEDCPKLFQCDPTFVCNESTGDCCSANPTPGCEHADCCIQVCSCDPFCCDDGWSWDAFCAEFGLNSCNAAELCPQCGGGQCSLVNCTNNEGEPCGQSLNDGCAADPANPQFAPIACGQTICGNLWAAPTPESPGGARDTDWYLLDLTQAAGPVEVTWTTEATHPVLLYVMRPQCEPELDIIIGPLQACEESVTLCLDPGEYVFYISPTAFDGFPCPGFAYEMTVSCDSEACYSGQCKGNCGGGFGPPGCYSSLSCECYCDDNCAAFGDCCLGICFDCPTCFGCPGGQGCND